MPLEYVFRTRVSRSIHRFQTLIDRYAGLKCLVLAMGEKFIVFSALCFCFSCCLLLL